VRLPRLEQSLALDQDDILLSPGSGGEVLLKILCDYENRVGKLEVLQADRPSSSATCRCARPPT
jgi:hypothetical protein